MPVPDSPIQRSNPQIHVGARQRLDIQMAQRGMQFLNGLSVIDQYPAFFRANEQVSARNRQDRGHRAHLRVRGIDLPELLSVEQQNALACGGQD